ncbi:Por secretion system C-terminal sorting domain-containing protein [Chryseobacterium oleae]|uniref:Por secretion system C-terminal sorting domain-containing protein n=1 Tax=Chryseobacterium oleae TaxID=491207 RepID=A0A1I4ZS99_CHROL|nr:T9SS type A sorting domain-containing protein [Chryseobacterium oleae]SFN53144.1 Por secretion system C-terminal sorting domain-containing protein [Chryseobacterium oleae]
MRKSLFAIGLLAISYSVQAQVLCHVDTNANMYVSEGTLVYSGGGVQTKGNGLLDVHGNVMVVGTAGDAFKTIDAAGGDKTDGGNIILRLNTPGNTDDASTYGQLYVDGLSQAQITGIVSKEFRTKKHGNGDFYQQVAMPFSGKVLNTLSTELGKTFGTVRRSKNEILKWNNTGAVADFTDLTTPTSDATGYYMLGSANNNLDTSSALRTVNGRPYTTLASNVSLQNGGNVSFNAGGSALNAYNERYNTYLQDQFEVSITPWANTYGKNIYQFGNPFLTNLDLSKIGYVENGGTTDNNNIPNLWGVRYDPGTVTVGSQGNAYSSGALIQTYALNGVPVGDIGMIIKPMQTFVLKLRTSAPQALNFNTLRRFNQTVRAAATDYSVTAAKNGAKSTDGTVKQLGVIGLDANGNELARTYYVVSPDATTGHQTSIATTVQATATSENMIGTFEEALNGGYDSNYTAQYWLYINEANENNFKGKNVKLVNYKTDKVKSYKFEIRENGELVPTGTHLLSAGIGFYYKASNGTVQQATQGGIAPNAVASYDLYYGDPNNVVLGTKDTNNVPSRTMVVYNPEITNYIVRFDPNWKKADIEVYDMSGKLVISKKAVDASRDFVIELNGAVKNSYVVKIVSDKGETVNTKILK